MKRVIIVHEVSPNIQSSISIPVEGRASIVVLITTISCLLNVKLIEIFFVTFTLLLEIS